MKKSLYYVWFLGAKESKGLRGTEYILPVIKNLELREKDVEPFKVTLQVSHKGLKIIQNVVTQTSKGSKPKNETIKHFIPHNTITCVHQQDDIIACILLLFNPVTKCPLHIHAYRCDSVETATLLKEQLQMLIEKPENQKKFAEIEGRLNPIKELKKVDSSLGSDTGTSTKSESSEERFGNENVRVTNLYDSVAAELRAKLGKNNVPILLPPRDYDTVHRQKGNLTGIELRRCLNANIVGQNVKSKIESSGGSSGIGSDHPPSPESPDAPESRFHTLDSHSTSDEEWNVDGNESTLYLMHSSPQINRSLRSHDLQIYEEHHRSEKQFSRYRDTPSSFDDSPRSPKDKLFRAEKFLFTDEDFAKENISKYLERPISKFGDNKLIERQRSLERERVQHQKSLERDKQTKLDRFEREREIEKERVQKEKKIVEKQKSAPTTTLARDKSSWLKERQASIEEKLFFREKQQKNVEDPFFKTASKTYYHSEKNERHQDEEPFKSQKRQSYEPPREKTLDKPVRYFDDDGFDENIRYRRPEPEFEKPQRRYPSEYYQDKTLPNLKTNKIPIPKIRQKYQDSEDRFATSRKEEKYVDRFDDYKPTRPKSSIDLYNVEKIKYYDAKQHEEIEERKYEENIKRRQAQYRQRSASPEEVVEKVSPRDRFKDAKEKFLQMEKERLMEQRKKDHNMVKRHESMIYPTLIKDRYYDDRPKNYPKAAPRNTSEEIKYRPREREAPTNERDKYKDQKRRSMFSMVEEDHKKVSTDIAQELRRRSYMDSYDDFGSSERNYQDLPESERYNIEPREPPRNYKQTLDRNNSVDDFDQHDMPKYDQKFVKNQKVLQNKNIPGYRHSYAEPQKIGKMSKFNPEMLHRANSSVNNNGRVGIASVHPY